MNVLLFGLFLILLAFLIHLFVWKIHCPKYQTKTLLWIFFGTYFFSIPFLELFLSAEYKFSFYTPKNFFDYLHSFLFFTSFTLAYLITYSALEVDSPSLVIVKLIFEAGPDGLDRNVLVTKLTDEILLFPRINNLLRDKMAVMKEGRLFLTARGKWFIQIFIFYRFLLKAKKGG